MWASKVTTYCRNKFNSGWVPVAHTYNPSYSGGRDQKDSSLKQDKANSTQDPISKEPTTKRAGGVAQGVGLEFKPLYCQKKKEKSSL
jgi:hypothetical protein